MMCRNSSSLVLMLPLLALLGCDPGGGGGTGPQVSVALEPAAVTLPMAGTQRFTATVTGASDTSVTWTATGGEISQAGEFTAPRQEGMYRVRATSVADTARYAESVVTVTKPPPPTIQVFTAAASTINVGEGTTLNWEATGATSLSIEPDVGTVTGTSVTVTPGHDDDLYADGHERRGQRHGHHHRDGAAAAHHLLVHGGVGDDQRGAEHDLELGG
ncbi:hypothetical protein Q664_30395 [Archangium violaceum Cb vi76]|uniref:Ig-like domain-containing protein n=1 Tax=Archangium violaceum Cb vi76 TaxID=1406225 RepID=A0A084SP83_9BACT|nr:hypothetical protein Q664_30395 [Archangium violaceum Cb vi76]